MISKQSRMTSHRMLIHVATETLIKTLSLGWLNIWRYAWINALISSFFVTLYLISSWFIYHRFLLKTSYWYQVFWFGETLVTCKFFIHWYIVKLKSMSHAYISLAVSSLFNEKSSASQLGFYDLQSEPTEVLIVDIFLLQRDYLSLSFTQLYAISKLFSSCPLEIIFLIKRL